VAAAALRNSRMTPETEPVVVVVAVLHSSPRHSQYLSLMRDVPVRPTQPWSGRPSVAHVRTIR